jgi:hypothetical protein
MEWDPTTARDMGNHADGMLMAEVIEKILLLLEGVSILSISD